MPHQAPAQIDAKSLADYLEVMTKAVFQSGISWSVVENKWLGTREAFSDFDPETVAGLTPPDVDRLTQDTRLIRHRKKIEATVFNAGKMIELASSHASFPGYLRSFPSYEALEADMRKQFKFMGETGIYYMLWVVKEPVPDYDEWCAARKR